MSLIDYLSRTLTNSTDLKRVFPQKNSHFHEFYTGIDRKTKKKLFIKVDKQCCGSVEREVDILKLPLIKNSPHFPKILYEGKRESFSFAAFEYIQGEMLTRYLYRRSLKRQLQKEEFFKQLLEIGMILFEEKIVHRDIRPGNIFVTRNTSGTFNRIILIDFAFSVGMDRFPELPILKEKKMLKGLGMRKYKPNDYEWDNFYALEKVGERLDRNYRHRYPHFTREIASYTGKQVYTHSPRSSG
ncbi:serine/threonine protein kinase [Evansella vedderi]|uniref:Serine/threonine protein kinase n=1 Tax=Evansella vedderi TaxID=38282 RepID=A0ABT9ZVV3_9BACI|nr:AarF/UbiB family protein [Evansella vedderi]MDQ0255366.1 serine/threonine protein kinase [Evansella vedderi]